MPSLPTIDDPLLRSAFRVAGTYAVVAGLWIGTSDAALARWIDPDTMASWSMAKGLGFVSVTAVLLFAATYHQLCARLHSERALVRQLRDQQSLLRTLGRAAAERAERERQALARDVHDDLGQVLTAAQLALRADGPGSEERANELLDQALQRVRQVARQLRPPALDHAGLGPALEQLAEQLSTPCRPVDVFVDADAPDLPSEQAIHVYRVAQEALTNAQRHAEADVIAMQWTRRGDAGALVVEDDGEGLARGHRRGTGMHSMRERSELLGADLRVVPANEQGTRVELLVPLAAA